MSASLCPWKAHPSFTADLKSKSLLLMSDVRILRKQWVALCHVLNTLPPSFPAGIEFLKSPISNEGIYHREREGEGGRVTPIGLILLGGEKYKKNKRYHLETFSLSRIWRQKHIQCSSGSDECCPEKVRIEQQM